MQLGLAFLVMGILGFLFVRSRFHSDMADAVIGFLYGISFGLMIWSHLKRRRLATGRDHCD